MKLLIVDDHVVVREGLAAVLRQADPATLVLPASSGQEGLELAIQHPDLDAVLLDLAMPAMSGMAAIGEFGRVRPDLPVIVLTSNEDPAEVHRAMAAGALGYVPKSASAQTLLQALKLVLAGEIYVPPLLLSQGAKTGKIEHTAELSAGTSSLTERQTHVLKLLSQGLSNKEIGNMLGLSDKTVKAHVTAIFKALNVVNRTQAANAARLADIK